MGRSRVVEERVLSEPAHGLKQLEESLDKLCMMISDCYLEAHRTKTNMNIHICKQDIARRLGCQAWLRIPT
jgi:hypothetical protein